MAVTRIWDADNGQWQTVGGLVGGSVLLGSAVGTTAINGIAGSWVNLGVDVTFNVPAGRLIRITSHVLFYGYVAVGLRRFDYWLDGVDVVQNFVTTYQWDTIDSSYIYVPTAGTHTVSLRALTDANTMDVGYRYLTVEDVTPNASPIIPAPVNAYPVAQVLTPESFTGTTTPIVGAPAPTITVGVTSYLLLHWGCQVATGSAGAGQYMVMYPQIAGIFAPGNPDDEAYLVAAGPAYHHSGRSRLIGPVPPGTYVVQSAYRASQNGVFSVSRRWMIVEGKPV
jgi:hypothetical protein